MTTTQQILWAMFFGYVAGIFTIIWLEAKKDAQVKERRKQIEEKTKKMMEAKSEALKQDGIEYQNALNDFNKFHTDNADKLRKHGIQVNDDDNPSF